MIRRISQASFRSNKPSRIFFSSSSDSSSKPDRVETSIDSNGIAHVTLNRPDKLNALDLPMFEEIVSTARSLSENKSLRAVILSGKGRAFCTGLDVRSVLKSPRAQVKRLLERDDGHIGNLAQNVAMEWRNLPVPVICCLHGMCFGGGMQIALGADFRVAHPDTKLSIMESKWGLIPDMGASVTLRELLPIDKIKLLTMTGRVLNATEAADMGLVTLVVEDPLAEAEAIATEIAKRSPDAVALTKRLYQETWVEKEEVCLKIETDLQRKLLATWNQLAASGRNYGWEIPYLSRKDDPPKRE
jgi:enoyl-CoA hydratase/carnithine racemase